MQSVCNSQVRGESRKIHSTAMLTEIQREVHITQRLRIVPHIGINGEILGYIGYIRNRLIESLELLRKVFL